MQKRAPAPWERHLPGTVISLGARSSMPLLTELITLFVRACYNDFAPTERRACPPNTSVDFNGTAFAVPIAVPSPRIVQFLKDFPVLSFLCDFAPRPHRYAKRCGPGSLREILFWLRLCRAKSLREILGFLTAMPLYFSLPRPITLAD
jgi:hypothetical protein